jgi:hypothetical protein
MPASPIAHKIMPADDRVIFAPQGSILAAHSGYCPVCGRYIRKSASWVSRLSHAIPPQEPDYHGRYGDDRPRAWVHAHCRAEGERLADEIAPHGGLPF